MKSAALLIAVAMSAFIFTGCRSPNIDYTPNPQTIKNREEAKAIIFRAFAEEYRKLGVQDLTVDDEKIMFYAERRNLITLGSMRGSKAIYFDSIEKITLSHNRRHDIYVVILWRANRVCYKLNCITEDMSKSFIDAIRYMQQHDPAAASPIRPCQSVSVK